MGQSSAKNFVSLATDITAELESEVINEAIQTINADMSFDVDINNSKFTDSIFSFSGNELHQGATIDLTQVATTMVDQQFEQELKIKVAEAAEAMTSGINLMNSSKTENVLRNFVNLSTRITSSVNNLCLSKTEQDQSITVKITDSDVAGTELRFDDNTMTQIADQVADCTTDVVTNQKYKNLVDQVFDVTATSTTEGFSLWALVALGVVVLLFVFMPLVAGLWAATTGVTGVLKALLSSPVFLLLFAGFSLLVAYWLYRPTIVDSVGFSTGLGSRAAGGEEYRAPDDVTATDIAQMVLESDEYVAYDYRFIGKQGPPRITLFKELKRVPVGCGGSGVSSKCDIQGDVDPEMLFGQSRWYWNKTNASSSNNAGGSKDEEKKWISDGNVIVEADGARWAGGEVSFNSGKGTVPLSRPNRVVISMKNKNENENVNAYTGKLTLSELKNQLDGKSTLSNTLFIDVSSDMAFFLKWADNDNTDEKNNEIHTITVEGPLPRPKANMRISFSGWKAKSTRWEFLAAAAACFVVALVAHLFARRAPAAPAPH